MKLLKTLVLPVIAATLILFLSACTKEEGEGGSSSIKGYVHVTDYNINMLIIQGEYPGADEEVYIVYGDDIQYGDRIRSGPDGKFEFKYLQKGNYTIYVYSQDTTLAGKHAVSKSIEITKNHQTIDAGTIEIAKK
jgi:hypothetical protein